MKKVYYETDGDFLLLYVVMHSKSGPGLTTVPNIRIKKDYFFTQVLFLKSKNTCYVYLVLFLCFDSDGRKFMSQFRIPFGIEGY